MEAVSPSRAWRKHRGADHPRTYEVRYAGTGALHSFEAVDNVAQALAQLPVGSKSWFSRREPSKLPDLEYRTCATPRRPTPRPPRNA
jgi:hypothetical protein